MPFFWNPRLAAASSLALPTMVQDGDKDSCAATTNGSQEATSAAAAAPTAGTATTATLASTAEDAAATEATSSKNRIFPIYGDNALKSLARSHPAVLARWHPDLAVEPDGRVVKKR